VLDFGVIEINKDIIKLDVKQLESERDLCKYQLLVD
jgi:hypothetical protein